MARLLWLADCLRAAGLTVHEVPDWRTRGADSYGPVAGVTIHETRGSATSTDAGEISVLLNGSNTAPPPIAQLYLSRNGHWHVVASGTCFHNKIGWGGPNKNLGNDSLLGIEAQHAASENWANKPVQYQSYVRGVAALIARGGWPVLRVAGHKEHQPGDKPDPAFDMNQFRRDVAAVMATPGGDDMATLDELRVAPWQYKNATAAAAAAARGEDYPDMHAVVWETWRRVQALGAPAAPQLTPEQLAAIATQAGEHAAALIGGKLDALLAEVRRASEAEKAGLQAELDRLKAGQ